MADRYICVKTEMWKYGGGTVAIRENLMINGEPYKPCTCEGGLA